MIDNNGDYRVDQLKLIKNVAVTGGAIYLICKYWRFLLLITVLGALGQGVENMIDGISASLANPYADWRDDAAAIDLKDCNGVASDLTVSQRAKYCTCYINNSIKSLDDATIKGLMDQTAQLNQEWLKTVANQCSAKI
jgi:hypothetical protein